MPPIFAFDFSMAKPAMACLIDGRLVFCVWPSEIDDRSAEILEGAGIRVYNRSLPKIQKGKFDEHSLIIEHVKRSTDLAEKILGTIRGIMEEHGSAADYGDVIISNEGFAFSAKGNAALDLSGYKYILMSTLMGAGFKKFRTYSPITLKKTAGCSKKGLGKNDMISAISGETDVHPFIGIIREHPELLKKKSAYAMCVDDVADAYWCLKTTIEKEGLKWNT